MISFSRVLCLAYDWVLTPPSFPEFDVALVVSSKLCPWSDGEKSHMGRFTDLDAEPSVFTYHALLRPRERDSVELSDISGLLGLLWPSSVNRGAAQKALAFERLVADALLWELCGHSNNLLSDGNDSTLVLVTGPLIPKLRGRLLYRNLSDRLYIVGLTYKDEWVRRIEAFHGRLPALSRSVLDARFSSVVPPFGADSATRSWLFLPPKAKDSIHCEIIDNDHFELFEDDNWSYFCRMLVHQFSPANREDLIESPDHQMAKPFADTINAAMERRIFEQQFLQECLSLIDLMKVPLARWPREKSAYIEEFPEVFELIPIQQEMADRLGVNNVERAAASNGLQGESVARMDYGAFYRKCFQKFK